MRNSHAIEGIILATLSDFWRLTKPRVTLAIFSLFILAISASAGASSLNQIQIWQLGIGSFIVLVSVAGSNVLNNRIDFDIDKIMNRTKHREIPSGKISISTAQIFGLALVTLSIILALMLDYFFLIFLFVGLVSYLIVYTVTLKRHHVLNVLSAGPAVASPVWIGWIIGRGYLDLAGFLTGVLVMIWGPFHLWSLAAVYSEDYKRAFIPMLTATISSEKSNWYLLLVAIIMSSASFSLYFLGYYGIIYLLGLIFMNSLLLFITSQTVIKSSRRYNWLRYKFSAPYMIIILLFAAIDKILI